MEPHYPFINYPGIGFIGYYKNSKPFGTFWSGMIGGWFRNAFLHGIINEADGSITGDNIAYIYPDMETVFKGKFEDRKMVDTQETKILETNCDENGLLFVSRYSKPNSSSPHFYYQPPTNTSFGGGPKGVMDPFEQKWLELKIASNPKMEEGVFAKRDFKKGELTAIYNGFMFTHANGEFDLYKRSCWMNVSKSEDERRHCVKYSIKIPAKDAEMSIPPEHDVPGKLFPALGPKVKYCLYL